MSGSGRIIAIYTSSGDVGGFVHYPYVFNRQGEWIGWVTPQRQVYSVHGHYAGWLSDDPRILRKHSSGHLKPRLAPPAPVERIATPASVPLAPMMPELPIGTYDVLEERPELLPSIDDDEPNYHPTPERPLVYQPFGLLDEPKSLVLWDNYSTLHRGIFDFGQQHRLMHRVSFNTEWI